jgi:hypothetical protein
MNLSSLLGPRTCLKGYAKASLNTLAAKLGNPRVGYNEKMPFSWEVWHKGVLFTVYCYKDMPGIGFSEYDWHIGGDMAKGLQCLIAFEEATGIQARPA